MIKNLLQYKNIKKYKKTLLYVYSSLLIPTFAIAQSNKTSGFYPNKTIGVEGFLTALLSIILIATIILSYKVSQLYKKYLQRSEIQNIDLLKKHFSNLSTEEIELLQRKKSSPKAYSTILFLIAYSIPNWGFSQNTAANKSTIFSQPGVIITLVLILIPILFGIIYALSKVYNLVKNYDNANKNIEAEELVQIVNEETNLPSTEELEKLKQRLNYKLSGNELSGDSIPNDKSGLINNINTDAELHFFATKRPPIKRPKIDPELTKLILWYISTAILWLLVGTTIGEYVGIKFVAPDADTLSFLSIGRLRPVHTNLVFWGWATLGIMALGYYIVPMVSNTPLNSIKKGYTALKCINFAMFTGSILLMAGVNNAGGEYREIIWPIMAVWGYGLLLTVINFIKTIAKRTTKEVYISNWYIVSAYIFILIVATISYLPFGQNGIGETIVQGYYMHQAVGMWFMFSMLGVLYYLLPQQLNKPIYSYSLGVLAFWSQILFYTVIGTHHFVFSALPWWLQTVAIIGSVGMLIPVTSGTINYLMTLKGSWSKISNSYSLPFFFVGIIYYFTGSFQGTAEAFRETNLIWHFTDFTIAHSHITMYGIITFLLFGSIYAIVPRLTGKEPPQLGVGAHFWMALIGLQFYTIPLMIGGTLKGLSWAEGKPFIDSVVLMAPYWLWRAIGGSLMWASHIVLAYNMYKMIKGTTEIDVKQKAFEILKQQK